MIALAPYLTRLCETLAASMVAESRPVSIDCRVDGGTVSAGEAVSMGLIVTELVINALKHAFIDDRAVGRIAVTYDLAGDAWRLAVSDDGIGKCAYAATTGLGTSIVEALVSHLDSFLVVATSPGGTTVTISHRTKQGELSVPPLMRRSTGQRAERLHLDKSAGHARQTPRQRAQDRPSEASHPENPG